MSPTLAPTCVGRHDCRCLLHRAHRARLKVQYRADPEPWMVDPRPAAAELARWIGWGYPQHSIALATGVDRKTLAQLAAGRVGRVPRRRYQQLAELTHLQVIRATAPDGLIPATGTRRRLQALATQGWSTSVVRGVNPDRLRAVRASASVGQVSRATWDAVRVAYDEYAMDRRGDGHGQRTRAMAMAAKWAPPLAWDDDLIDDPTAGPSTGALTGMTLTERYAYERAMFLDDLELLLWSGMSAAEVCAQMHMREGAVERRLRREARRLAAVGDVAESQRLVRRARLFSVASERAG